MKTNSIQVTIHVTPSRDFLVVYISLQQSCFSFGFHFICQNRSNLVVQLKKKTSMVTPTY